MDLLYNLGGPLGELETVLDLVGLDAIRKSFLHQIEARRILVEERR